MKTFKFIGLFVFLTILGNAQPTWVTFTGSSPSKPVIQLSASNTQRVKYNVIIPGMYSETINNTVEYQRLSIPGSANWGLPGYPGIPDISKLIAIPECSGYSLTIEPLDSLIFNNINLYPVPLSIKDSSGIHEQFYKIDSVYSIDFFYPGINTEAKDGYLRSQKILNVTAYPFKYSPQQKILVVYNNFNVTVDFQSSTSDVNVDNGLFNKISEKALLNFSSNNSPSMPNLPPPMAGSVTWKTLNSCSDADQIIADYLIITYDQFFSPHSQALQRFANHKAIFNGLDVVIVNVPNILSKPWTIDPATPPNLIAERKIREFIRRVFVGHNAIHTYDGQLAFVCLVGDSEDDPDETFVPSSWDPDPTCDSQGHYLAYNDYYYSCVTKNAPGGDWDLFGDLFIGRIVAHNETELNNYTTKLIHNENEFTNQTWRNNTIISYGAYYNNVVPDKEHSYWTTELVDYLNTICPSTHHTEMIDAEALPLLEWRTTYTDYLNNDNEGANVVVQHGHGTGDEWSSPSGPAYSISNSYLTGNLANTGKYPIALANSCSTGAFAGSSNACIGEVLLNYSSMAGYVGYLGATIDVVTYSYNYPLIQDPNFFVHFLTALYANQSSVMGEAVLEARIMGINSGTSVEDITNFKYNLFGDPAYNCMTPGYEITGNLILPPAPPDKQTIMISNKVYIRSGGKLTINNPAIIEFGIYGQLIVDDGGTLEIGNNVEIKGMNSNNKIIVNGLFTGIGGTLANPQPIYGLTLSSLTGSTWGGIEFNNSALTVRLNGGSINNCYLSGSLKKIETNNNTLFTNSGINLTNSSLSLKNSSASGTAVSISNPQVGSATVEFLSSTFTNSSADALITLDHVKNYQIKLCNITYDHGTGIELNYSGNGTIRQIDQNQIQKSGDPSVNSWGIKVYSSKSDITQNTVTNNRYGLSCLNSSVTKVMGDASASSQSATQRIMNNYQNQIRSYDNSFPWYVHYNVLINNLASNSYLVYYDGSYSWEGGNDPDNPQTVFNVKCNCWDNSTQNPNSQLYPVGYYDYTYTWCYNGWCNSGQSDNVSFNQAIADMDSANYAGADSLFRSIIVSFPGSDQARESAKNLIPVTENSTMDFSALKTYYRETPQLHLDSLTDNLVYRLMNICDVKAKQYDTAINWYENDILNPASVEDSIYSLVDLSDTYMLMQADSGSKSFSNNFHGKLIQYIPKNHQEYVTRRQEWIKLLFKDDPLNPKGNEGSLIKDYELSQNNPNPFSTTTEISFVSPKDGDIRIIVTNIMGETVFNETQPMFEGKNVISLNLSGSHDGVYLVRVTFNNNLTKNLKITKQK